MNLKEIRERHNRKFPGVGGAVTATQAEVDRAYLLGMVDRIRPLLKDYSYWYRFIKTMDANADSTVDNKQKKLQEILDEIDD